MLRTAIVGLGWWGRLLVGSVQGKSEAIRFVAGQTRSRAKAEEFCRANDIRLVDTYEQVLADPQVDAVVLATPHSLHADQVKRAAAAGKHVFVEKPFTLTRRDAETALAAVEKAGVVLAVGFNRRFHPSMGELRARVRDGRLGRIQCCMGEQTAFAGLLIPPDGWRADPRETPAGAMTGIGIHTVDAVIDLFGRIAEVHCINTRTAARVDDTNAVLMRCENGVASMFFACIATVPNYRFAVYGSKGFAEITKPTLDDFRFVALPDQPPGGQFATPDPEVIERPGFNTLNAELVAFAAAVREKKAFPVTTDQVLHGVEVFEAIVNSAASGRPVAIR